MKMIFITIGKTAFPYVDTAIEDYSRRINRYTSFSYREVPGLKKAGKLDAHTYRRREGALLAKQIDEPGNIILLDVKGKAMNSEEFAKFVGRQLPLPQKTYFLCGGPYGFPDELYQMAHHRISLSPMTFSHQIIRVVFMEQLYRAFTIIHHHPYHNG